MGCPPRFVIFVKILKLIPSLFKEKIDSEEVLPVCMHKYFFVKVKCERRFEEQVRHIQDGTD